MHGSEEWVYVLTDKFGSWFGLRDFYYFIIRAYIYLSRKIYPQKNYDIIILSKRES